VASALPGLQIKLHKDANVTASKMAATALMRNDR
jgi:hypothetical protein